MVRGITLTKHSRKVFKRTQYVEFARSRTPLATKDSENARDDVINAGIASLIGLRTADPLTQGISQHP